MTKPQMLPAPLCCTWVVLRPASFSSKRHRPACAAGLHEQARIWRHTIDAFCCAPGKALVVISSCKLGYAASWDDCWSRSRKLGMGCTHLPGPVHHCSPGKLLRPCSCLCHSRGAAACRVRCPDPTHLCFIRGLGGWVSGSKPFLVLCTNSSTKAAGYPVVWAGRRPPLASYVWGQT